MFNAGRNRDPSRGRSQRIGRKADEGTKPAPAKKVVGIRAGGPGASSGFSSTRSRPFVVEDQIGFLLRALSQRNTILFAKEMVDGLTRVQFTTMAKLFEVGACSQNELGRLILMDRATIKEVVGRLRKRGFIETLPYSADRRQRVLTLTKLGDEVVKRAVKVAPRITDKMLAPLGANERIEIVRLLRKICDDPDVSDP